MTDINKIVLVGRVTKDSRLAYTKQGIPVANFSIANNQKKKQGDEWIDEVSFFECNLWGKLAESLNQYMVKGKQVIVSGKLKQERYTTTDGSNRSKIVINCDDIQLLGKNEQQQQSSNNSNQSTYSSNYEEDIPF